MNDQISIRSVVGLVLTIIGAIIGIVKLPSSRRAGY